MIKDITIIENILDELKTEINQLLGYHEGIPRINYGPCGTFAQLFYEAWNSRFTEKVHICFVMTLSRAEHSLDTRAKNVGFTNAGKN